MSEQKDPNMEIETLSEDDLESVSGGALMFDANNSGSGTCNNRGTGTCTNCGTGTCNNSGSGTCEEEYMSASPAIAG